MIMIMIMIIIIIIIIIIIKNDFILRGHSWDKSILYEGHKQKKTMYNCTLDFHFFGNFPLVIFLKYDNLRQTNKKTMSNKEKRNCSVIIRWPKPRHKSRQYTPTVHGRFFPGSMLMFIKLLWGYQQVQNYLLYDFEIRSL